DTEIMKKKNEEKERREERGERREENDPNSENYHSNYHQEAKTCTNCRAQDIPSRSNGWGRTKDGDWFCSQGCCNDYFQKLREEEAKKKREEGEEKRRRSQGQCSRCGSFNVRYIMEETKEKFCHECFKKTKNDQGTKKKKPPKGESFESDSPKGDNFSPAGFTDNANVNSDFSAEEKVPNDKPKKETKKPQPEQKPSSPPNSSIDKVQKSIVSEIKQELTNQEEELDIDWEEINLSPAKLAEEIKNLKNPADIENYKNNLKEQIQQKREEKLTVIKNNAINTIKEKLKNQKGELNGKYKDFETLIYSQNSAQQIAQLQEEILASLNQQQVKIIKLETKKENDWGKKIALGAVILGSLAGIGLIIWKLVENKPRKSKI
ncbi:MAG: hypothetical protein MRECE_52c002, partial [Mycoplasmataceae bacterium CE_OT135]